jgi:ubiquitin fusion degradation protein 1
MKRGNYNMYNNPGRKKIQINEIFLEVYRAYPASLMGRDDIEMSNSIILPPSALGKLSGMKNFGDSKNPILFKIFNIQLNIATHCGVIEFTAEEGICIIPTNMFEKLCLSEDEKVNLRNVDLKPGTFIKIQPHLTEFINNPQPKTILEYNLRNYFCVTEGDTISVKFGKKRYKLDITQCKPAKAIRCLNCDITVDFDPPKDYKEQEYQPRSGINDNSKSSIRFKSEDLPDKKLTEEEKRKQIEDKKFYGHHIRIDGKVVSDNQVKRIMKAKLENKNNEENYNPRECRIITNPRPCFKYVEL